MTTELPQLILVVGPPAAGKGTQSEWLAASYGGTHVSTGDLLRNAAKRQDALGELVRSVPLGTFAPDALVIQLVQAEVARHDFVRPMILDGFPRTVAQSERMLKAGLCPDLIIELDVSESVLVERIQGREVHPGSGRVYNATYNPPSRPHTDDITGEPLVRRSDDAPELLPRRLQDWQERTVPAVRRLLQEKIQCVPVSGGVSITSVSHAIKQSLEAMHLEFTSWGVDEMPPAP